MCDTGETQLFLGVDPGIRNIGLYCFTHTGHCVAQGTFGCTEVSVDKFPAEIGVFCRYVKGIIETEFLPVIAKQYPGASISCCIEKQFKAPYIEISGVLACLFAQHNINVAVIHCSVARETLGIPIRDATKQRNVLKKRVMQYVSAVTRQPINDLHCADAFVMACYARFLVLHNCPQCPIKVNDWFSSSVDRKRKAPAAKKKKPATKKRTSTKKSKRKK